MVASSASRPPLAPPRSSSSTSTGAAAAQRRQPSTAALNAAEQQDKRNKLRTLELFAACVREEFEELVAEFEQAEGWSFARFRELWATRRLTNVFHIEFWDSTPSAVHHVILQTAMELLLEEVASNVASVAAIGHLFALHCAFSVQLSDPKIKVSIDPAAWQTLGRLPSALTLQLGIADQRQLAREALAVLRQLVYEEHAFLQCLGGSVADYRLSSKARIPLSIDHVATSSAPLVVPSPVAPEETEELLMRLSAFESQYNTRLKLLAGMEKEDDNAIGAASTSAGVPSFLRRSRPPGQVDSLGGLRGSATVSLWNNEREKQATTWLDRVRRTLCTSAVAEVDDESSEHLLSDQEQADDHDDLASVDDLDADAEDVAVTDHGQPPSIAQRVRLMSIASSTNESDGLDELEAELLRNISDEAAAVSAVARPRASRAADPVPSKPAAPRVERHRETQQQPPPVVPGRRPRLLSDAISIATESDGLAELEAELARDVPPSATTPSTSQAAARAPSTQRPTEDPPARSSKRKSTAAAPPVRRSRRLSDASSAMSDLELAELQAELARLPTAVTTLNPPPFPAILPRPRRLSADSSATETDDELALLAQELATMPSSSSALAPPATQPRKRTPAKPRTTNTKQPPRKPRSVATTPKPRAPRAKAPPKSKPRQPVSTQVAPVSSSTIIARPRISSRASVASTQDSDGLDDLERELQAFPSAL